MVKEDIHFEAVAATPGWASPIRPHHFIVNNIRSNNDRIGARVIESQVLIRKERDVAAEEILERILCFWEQFWLLDVLRIA